MGGGATRLYSALNRPQALPEPHNNTTLDPAFCKEHRGSIVRSSDPEELRRQCEDALRDRPPRFHRKFIHINEDENSASSGHFRVMQWNILAQALGEGMDSFVQCPLEALSWSQRKYLILEEILTHRPHILCLQEVDHYFDTFQPVLAGLGYCSNFCPKPWSPCLDVEGNNGPDGCALFYDQSEFELLDSVNIRLSAMRIPTNQVAVVTMLRSHRNNRCVCIAVTHLKARAGWEWLRSAQGSDLLRQLQNLVQRHSPSPADPIQDIPLLVCGDFNAVPSEEVYRRFTGSLLGLDSAYKKLSQDGTTEPAYTTWKIRPSGECCSTLDYIWYTKGSLRVEAVLDMPTEEQIGPNRLPSFNYPSDHLSLVCDFSFKERH
ncbi:nocturnin isoform X2 [Boleophthalmus pectinirostris]|nr:nocturnin isoform X2 [Boleophthalmus pectinirostris]XP_055013806.1 nocturnin isoform X2 [Boleophthalmus pectinirostris]XP_055013807.1 nocturnin isoform X2 [Boleophthalmus pectinirostris]